MRPKPIILIPLAALCAGSLLPAALAAPAVKKPAAHHSKRQDALDHALIEAAAEGDLGAVKTLLAKGADVNGRSMFDTTPLIAAARVDETSIAGYLLGHGADIKAHQYDGETALHMAAAYGTPALVKLLLEHGADVNARTDDGSTPLVAGASQWFGDRQADSGAASVAVPIVTLLLAHGAAVDAKDSDGNTALLTFLGGGSPQRVPVDGDTEAGDGDPDAARVLIEHGADVNAKDQIGNTPLTLAARGSAMPRAIIAIAALIDHGANVNAKDGTQTTPLMAAATVDDGSIVSVLIDSGAEIDARDGAGDTALMRAAKAGNADTVAVLIAAGADRSLTDKKGLTAAEIAERGHAAEIAAALRRDPETRHFILPTLPLPFAVPAPPAYHVYSVTGPAEEKHPVGDVETLAVYRVQSVDVPPNMPGVPAQSIDSLTEIRATFDRKVVAVDVGGDPNELLVSVKSATGRDKPGAAMAPLTAVGADLKVVLWPVVRVTRMDGKPIPVFERLLWKKLFEPQGAGDITGDPDSQEIPATIHVGDTWSPPMGGIAAEMGVSPDTRFQFHITGTTVVAGRTYLTLTANLNAPVVALDPPTQEQKTVSEHIDVSIDLTVPAAPDGHVLHSVTTATAVIHSLVHIPGAKDIPLTVTSRSVNDVSLLEPGTSDTSATTTPAK
jgi:ankyrin repeat protein